VGSGENLNEHVVGEGWPMVDVRQDMLAEAITLIRELLSGELVTWEGDYFRVDSARIWDAPEGGVPIGVAVSGEKSIEQFAPLGDHLVAVEPNADLVTGWKQARPSGAGESRTIGQVPICWDRDRDRAVQRAHEQFRWFAGGWAVNADLPTPAGFSGATQLITPEQVAEQIPCGADLDAIVEAVKPYWEAGFTDIAVVQVGDEGQDQFLAEAAADVLEALRSAAR
jgi:G6PDH family F420-dependent oxidoreductase